MWTWNDDSEERLQSELHNLKHTIEDTRLEIANVIFYQVMHGNTGDHPLYELVDYLAECQRQAVNLIETTVKSQHKE
jgi:hypothetical protein